MSGSLSNKIAGVNKVSGAKQTSGVKSLEFENNLLLPDLYGAHGQNLARIEQVLSVSLINRGNLVFVEGDTDNCRAAAQVLQTLYARLESGAAINSGDVDGAMRFAQDDEKNKSGNRQTIKTRKNVKDRQAKAIHTQNRDIIPRSPNQAAYIEALLSHELVLGLGPAGTGKTYLAVAAAASLLLAGKVERIILSRPALEAGERLGFLPGDMREKVDPYLRPLYDALYDMLPAARVERALECGDIEIAPLAFMRGRTLRNAFIILDEAQNTTTMQMKMFLTRLGEGSHMVINGDPSQIDLPKGQVSGLADALDVLSGLAHDNVLKIVRFTQGDVVRHDLVAKIITAYEARKKGKSNE